MIAITQSFSQGKQEGIFLSKLLSSRSFDPDTRRWHWRIPC